MLFKNHAISWRMANRAMVLTCLVAGTLVSCKKLVQIAPPTSGLTTTEVFADSIDANSAVLGIYSSMISTGQSLGFGSGSITLFTGLSGDELVDYNLQYQDLDYDVNKVLDGITDNLWETPYTLMYAINSCIQSIQASTGISATAKTEMIGEAEFLRAFCYFYLVNLYGDVPLVLGTDYKINDTASRTPTAQVYQQIIADLKDAETRLRSDYSIAGGQPTRANQAVATALLARVYLYTGDMTDAVTASSSVINNPAYNLVPDLNSVFLVGSSEAILQWQLSTTGPYPFNATPEGYQLQPLAVGAPPLYYLSPYLVGAFEPNDGRYTAWVDSVNVGQEYYYANKYKIGAPQAAAGATPTEYYMVLRLAEQYLIRAEAEANGASGGNSAAIADLNIIRNRANLPPLADTLNTAQVLAALAQERRIELFAEWGNRWLDLKRTKAIDSVMTVTTPLKGGNTAWASYQQLYPVPLWEISNDHNITQNPQY
jgi:starch-binding outer membrane protein, SusD/RagB family